MDSRRKITSGGRQLNQEGIRNDDFVTDPVFTGYFRDGIRRIDLVMVVQDTRDNNVEKLKIEFLMSTINTGLDLEIEMGVETPHQHLLFIKVHAPDSILAEYGSYYDMRKYFKNSHVEYIKPDPFIADTILPCMKIKYEREWIKLIRAQYPGPLNYSTLERSNIVYRILLMMPFGAPENYFSLHRLLENNIVLDAYPLHDGPYVFLPDQDFVQLNGRQVLFYNWTGYRNLMKSQPLHVIREYLGERMAFFFAFYQFYNRALIIAAVVGCLVFYCGFLDTSKDRLNKAACTKYPYGFGKWFTAYVQTSASHYKNYSTMYYKTMWYKDVRGWHKIKANRSVFLNDNWEMNYFSMVIWKTAWTLTRTFRTVLYDDTPVCPKCRDFNTCPFRNITEYCTEVKIKNRLDNVFGIYFALFISVWAILWYIYWRRKENYLQWVWEVSDKSAANVIRPEFKIEHLQSTMSTLRNTRKFVIRFLMRLALTSAMIVFYIFGVVPLLMAFKYYLLNLTLPFDVDWKFLERTYMILGVVAMVNAAVIIILEKVMEVVAYKFAGYLNHRTEDTYELALVVKLYGFTFMINFSLIFYFAFIKGQFYTYPSDPNRWYLPLGLGIMNCGMLTCIDELFIIFIITWLSKRIFIEMIDLFQRNRTDYNRGTITNARVPCWEKEYCLYRLDEDFIMKKYKDLLIQFAFTTFFVYVFPPAPMVAFLINKWDIRYLAELVLLRSRRPLMLKAWGLGAWRVVVFGLPYAATLCNALTITLNSNLIDKQVHEKHFNNTRYFVDYAMGVFNTSDYHLETGRDSPAQHWAEFYWTSQEKQIPYSDFCVFPGKWNRRVESFEEKRVYDNSYTTTMAKWYVNWYQACFFLLYTQTMVVVGLILHYLIPTCPTDIEETQALEEIVKTYTIQELKKEE